jgi:hypothetical protein
LSTVVAEAALTDALEGQCTVGGDGELDQQLGRHPLSVQSFQVAL